MATTSTTEVAVAESVPATTEGPGTTVSTVSTDTTTGEPSSGQVLVIDSGWSIRLPDDWLVATDPVKLAELAVEEFDGDFVAYLESQVTRMAGFFQGAAISPDGTSVMFAVSVPAYPKRFDLVLAEQTLRSGFDQSPLVLVELGAEQFAVPGGDYGILGRAIYEDPLLSDPQVSFTLGTGFEDYHLTISVNAPASEELTALAVLESVEGS